jgi:hypothetical protein
LTSSASDFAVLKTSISASRFRFFSKQTANEHPTEWLKRSP